MVEPSLILERYGAIVSQASPLARETNDGAISACCAIGKDRTRSKCKSRIIYNLRARNYATCVRGYSTRSRFDPCSAIYMTFCTLHKKRGTGPRDPRRRPVMRGQ